MNQTTRHSVSVAAVVTNAAGHVLVIQRPDTERWEIPGGVLELDESIHVGLRREVYEETRLLIEPGPLTGVYKNVRLGVVALVFRASVTGGTAEPTDEALQVAWWSLDDVRIRMTDVFAVRVLDALSTMQPAIRMHDGIHLFADATATLPI